MAKTARVLARFGPKLPQLTEALLVRQNTPPLPPPPSRRWVPLLYMGGGAAVALAAVAIVEML
jgi:ubiquinone biosynthesis protein